MESQQISLETLKRYTKKALEETGKFLDPANTGVPILGPIRKFNFDMFGRPEYADPNLSVQQRLSDALRRYGETFMGAHGGLGKPSTPVKTGLQDIMLNQRSAVDALKRYDTTLGDARVNTNTPMLDINLYSDLLKQWQVLYGANRKPPMDMRILAEEVRDGLRAAMSKTKQGELNY